MDFQTILACVILSAFAGVCVYTLVHVIRVQMNK
jgi:hypothetical protein